MKKLLILLCLLLCCAFEMVQAQTVYFNIPDVVCMSRTNATANQIKFTSVNAMVEGAGLVAPQKADWSITTPNNTDADFEVLYSENAAATKPDKLKNTTALTLQFLVPGDYTFNITLYYKGADSVLRTLTRTATLRAEDCTINTCGDGGTTMAGFAENFGDMQEGMDRRNYPVGGVVQYNYQSSGALGLESYIITNNPAVGNSTWANTIDHTGGYRGAMLLVNPSVAPSQFYQKTVTGLCPGSVYNFSAWLMNVNTNEAFSEDCRSGYQYAGVTFRVVDAANPARVLNEFKTNSVSMMLGAKGPTWQRYGGTFIVPSDVNAVTVFIVNDKPGGCGNDIAIDDIEFSYCSPSIVAKIDGDVDLKEVLCEGAPITLTASYQPTGYFVDPVYQWQMSDDEGRTWINVPFGTGTTSSQLVISEGELKGTRKIAADYLFQVLIYERGSDLTTCASPSSSIRLTILPMPILNLTQSEVCAGTFVELEASGGFDYYEWKDLPGYTDTKRTIQVIRDTTITVYGFVTYADGHTCMDENSTVIKLVRSPRVDVAVSSNNVCVGQSVDLKINDVLNTYEITWFRGPDPVSGALTPMPQYNNKVTASQVQINSTTDNVFTVRVRDLANVCEVTSDPVIVNVSATPSTQLKPNPNVFCASANPTGNFNVEVDKITGATGSWRVEEIYGPAVIDDLIDNYVKILIPTVERTRVNIKKPGTSVVLSWTVKSPTNPACATTVLDTLHLLLDPTYSDAGRDTTQCGTDNIFIMNASKPRISTVADDPAAEEGKWTLVSGNATIAFDTAYNTAVTALDNEGDIVLRWTITNAAGCTANVDEVVLHKIGKPVINLVNPIISCNSKGFFVLDTASAKGTPTLYSITQGASPMPGFVNITDQPLVWPLKIAYPAATPPGVYTFNLSYKTAKAGCDSTIPFTVNVESGPTAATSITANSTNICGTGNTVTLTVNGGSLGLKSDGVTPNAVWAWYAGGCGTGTRLATGTTVTLPVTATTTYYVRAESLGACDTTACVSTTVTFTPMPAAVSAGGDRSSCNTTDFTMAASDPAPGTGKWALPTGTTATIPAGQINSRTAVITVPLGTSVEAVWIVTNGTCIATDTAVLTNFALPTAAYAGRDTIQCGNTQFTMKATPATIGVGTWTLPVGTTANITTGQENNPGAVINVPVGVTVTATWTTKNGTCISTDNVVLTNATPPTTAYAGDDQSGCGVASFVMDATPVTVGTGKWVLPAGTTATIPAGQINNPKASVTVQVGSSATLTWQTTNGACTTSDVVVLTNSVMPATAQAGKDVSQCNNSVFTLAANAPGAGGAIGTWSVVSPAGFVFPAGGIHNPNAVLSIPAGTIVVLRWTIANGGCSSSDDVTLSNSLAPNPATAGPNEAHCNNPAFTLSANSALGGTGTWRVLSPATFIFPPADIHNQVADLTVPAGTELKLEWTIANGGCTTSDTVVLTNYALPDVANAGPDQSQCAGLDFKMAGNKPTVKGATGTWSVISGTAAIAAGQANMDTAHVSLPAGGTAVLRWTMTNGNCSNSEDVTLTSIPRPTTANAGVDQQHCNNAQFTMAANSPVTGTATWSLPAGTSASIGAGDLSNPAAVVTVSPGTTATIAWVISNSTCNSVDSITLTNSVMPNNANAGADQVHCDDPNFVMNANNASPASAVGTWTIVGGAAVISDIHSPTATVTVQRGGTTTLRWTIANGACTSIPDEVVLTNQPAIQGNTITADQVLCASDAPAMLTGGAVSGGTGTFTYQWQMSTTNAITGFVNVTTGTGGNSDSYTPARITQNTWFRRVVTSGACTENISNAAMLTLMSLPPVVVSVPAPITVDCIQGTDYTTKFGTPVFSHAYNNETLTVTSNDVTTTVDACTFRIERTWTATNRCGLSAQAQQVITVTDKTAPVFNVTAPANVTVNCDAIPVAVNLTATDACSGPLTVTPIEVTVRQAGACPSNYQLIRKWVAVDACGNASDTLRQVLTVRDITPPVFNNPAPANITVNCDQLPAGQPLTATDNCTPGTITVNPVDVRKNLPGSKCEGNYQIIRTWTATDLCGNKAVLTQTITVQDNTKPVFSLILPPAITVDCDSVPDVASVTATDNCTASLKVKVSQRKEFLSTFCPSSYRLTRIWTAVDNCGNTATMQQVITVQDTSKPVFTALPPADTTVDCGAVPDPPASLKATDRCSAAKVTYLQTRENISGACAGNYRLIRTWTAKDECNNTTIARQVITVTDTTRPVIDPAPADVTLSCGDAIPVPATLYAKDNCDVNFPRKVTMVQDPFVVDKCAGYTIVRRWNIADACGNAAIERVQTITVNPCPKPELDPNMAANCSTNTRFAVLLKNKVNKPKFTLVNVVPATVDAPLTQSSNVFDLKGATQATFTVTDGVTGCVSDPVTYDLQYIEKPVVELGTDVSVCSGETVILDAGSNNAGYEIHWSTGATTQTITVTTSGIYKVTVLNGVCGASDEVKVTINNPPVVDVRDTTICEGSSITLNAYAPGATYIWSTGETSSSIDVYMQGTYGVDVSVNGCTTHDDVTVTLGIAPNVVLSEDVEICPDETALLTVEPDGGEVRWNNGETGNSIVVSRPGDYWVTVTRDGCVVEDTVSVSLKSHLDLDLGPQRDICIGGRVVLDATNADAVSYLWNDGDTNPVKEVTTAGKYIVSVMDRFCSQITMDSVKVTIAGIPDFDLGRDTTLCLENTLVLKVNAGEGNSIRWQDGATTSTYNVTSTGYYSVVVYNECGSVTDNIAVTYKPCEPNPRFPTAFTPNGDGKNDVFRPAADGPMYDYELRIYNRWGQQVFFGKDAKMGWDGRYMNNLVENGAYIWSISYKQKVGGPVTVVNGQITVIR